MLSSGLLILIFLLAVTSKQSHNINQRNEKQKKAAVVFPCSGFFGRDEDRVQ